MSKPISNKAFKKMLNSMSPELKQMSIARHLRVIPQKLESESNEKVVKHLKYRLRLIQKMWCEELVTRHA